MTNDIRPTIEKIMQGLKTKLERQIQSVAETQEHIGILEKQTGGLFKTSPK